LVSPRGLAGDGGVGLDVPGKEIFGIEGVKCCFSGIGGVVIPEGDEEEGEGEGSAIEGVSGKEKLISGREVLGDGAGGEAISGAGSAIFGEEGAGVGSETVLGSAGSGFGTACLRVVSSKLPSNSLGTESNSGRSKLRIRSNWNPRETRSSVVEVI
jgi:hypothetical protein